MELELLAKDDKSGNRGCPSVYINDSGEFVVQGTGLNDTELAELQNPLPGETAVRIAPEIVLRAVEHYRRRQA